MECLHCGDCCLRMSPVSVGPCPYIVQKDTFYFCSKYKDRPKECQNHTFHAKYCPIGMSILNLTDPLKISRRIDEGYNLLKEIHGESLMTEEKFKAFQNELQLIVGIIILMEEENFVERNLGDDNWKDSCNEKEYIRRVTKRLKNSLFQSKLSFYSKGISTLVRETFNEE